MIHAANDSQTLELEQIVEAFEQSYARDGHAEIASFLPEPGHPCYLAVLRELVRVDLEHRWQRGRRRRLEDYRADFPELFRDEESLHEIAFEEYRIRRHAGERPSADEYRTRFGVDTSDWSAGLQSGEQPAYRLNGSAAALERLGFRLIAELGKGAFGRVYLARQGDLANRFVVLKVSSDVTGESRSLAQLQHTNVVPIYSIHRSGLYQAVCMPYFGATTLEDVLGQLRRRSSLPASGRDLLSTLDNGKAQPLSTLAGAPADAQSVLVLDDWPCTEKGSGVLGDSTAERFPATPRTPDPFSVQSQSTATLQMLERLGFVEAVLWMAARLADGLAHAHERGILHRDLKPANILLTDEGQPMLLDFNLSADTKLRSAASAAWIGGTLPYMAPEHLAALQSAPSRFGWHAVSLGSACPHKAEGTAPQNSKAAAAPQSGAGAVDTRSDIYSLGIMLHELLTGQQPFPVRQGPLDRVLPQMIQDRQQRPPEIRCSNRRVSPAVEAIVRRCLDPDPGRRYQSARQLQEDLERHIAHLPLKHAGEPSLRERAQKWMRRHPRLMSSTGVVAIALVLITLLAASLAVRGQRLARLKAAETLHGFREDARTVKFLLNAPQPDAAQLDEGTTACRRAFDRFGVPDGTRNVPATMSAWTQTAPFRNLADPDRQRVRAEIGELLLLLARTTVQPAAGSSAETSRDEQDSIRSALRLNAMAQSCYGPHEVPRAVWSQRAELLRLAGQQDEARRAEQQAEAVPLHSVRDRYLSASEQLARGQFHEAFDLLNEANRQDPENFFVWLLLGNCHGGLGRPAQAAGCYSACAALWPEAHWPHYNRGLAHLDQKEYQQAGHDFDKAIELRPDHAASHINRGLARYGLEDYAGAVQDYSRALELGAAQTRVYFMSARAREKLGDREGARQDHAEGLRRVPTDEQSWIARGLARLASDPQGAIDDFDAALRLNPRSRAALENKAHVLSERLGRPEEAIAVLDQAVALHPDYVLARAGRGVLLARAGSREAAHHDAEAALARDTKPITQYQVAGIYALTSRQEADDRREALRLLASALRQEPRWLKVIPKDPDLDPIRNDPEFERLTQAAAALSRTGAPARENR